MARCDQATITDAAFVHLRGIKELDISYCSKITDAAFVHLRGIQKVTMACCSQVTITDAAFVNLNGIRHLNMHAFKQATIMGAAITHLVHIDRLLNIRCSQDVQDAAARLMGADYESESGDDFAVFTDEDGDEDGSENKLRVVVHGYWSKNDEWRGRGRMRMRQG